MQQNFTIPMQDQTKFELNSIPQEIPRLKGNYLRDTAIDAFFSSLSYFDNSVSGRIWHMVDLNFNIANQQLRINLAALPDGCCTVVLNLPDGNHLAYHFNGHEIANSAVCLENLPGLIGEFVEYLEFYED